MMSRLAASRTWARGPSFNWLHLPFDPSVDHADARLRPNELPTDSAAIDVAVSRYSGPQRLAFLPLRGALLAFSAGGQRALPVEQPTRQAAGYGLLATRSCPPTSLSG